MLPPRVSPFSKVKRSKTFVLNNGRYGSPTALLRKNVPRQCGVALWGISADAGLKTAMILHLDMDAFFASVEQLDDPSLRGRPVIVGGSGGRGVVSTASYEARRFGVHSAMPIVMARKLCPHGVFLPGRRARYAELSRRVMDVLGHFSPLVEQASIDEAYLDITGTERLFGEVERLVARIKAGVRKATGGLSCSVGVAPVKFLAKICSDINKPDGVYILRPEAMDAFLCALPVRKLPGVGRRMAARLGALGIVRVEQLRRMSAESLQAHFGKWGLELHERAFGRDARQVTPEHEAKSESSETTFEQDTRDRRFLERVLMAHAERVGASLRAQGIRGRTVTLKIKFADFRQITRSQTLPLPIASTQTLFDVGCRLLRAEALPQAVRLIGLGLSGFEDAPAQMVLPGVFRDVGEHDPAEEERRRRLDDALDAVRARFGKTAVQRGRLFTEKK